MAERGGRIFGGCCGTNPDFIREVIKGLEGLAPLKIEDKKYSAVCSATETIILGEKINIIGERINPTGKPKYREELKKIV